MNLRSTLCVAMAVAAGGLLGCGEQPKYYRVAIDRSPLDEVSGACYSSGEGPSDRTTNVVDVGQWIIWDGVDDRKYLQVGNINYQLGSSQVLIQGDALVSTGDAKKPTFTAERTQANPSRTSRATYTFDKLGETVEGTLALSFSCTGPGCTPGCDATLRFEGRRLDVDPTLQVSNTANN
ncbi:hypothetical protein [Archangium lipolyticum]|uniref:hypothetical protein n=1 Tax=Archangium lipolyticum TaxID=2970465 RepID=UPI00214A1E77|nr:hypothetical protein [Archangium lipolyticum]